jgi:hypothetical protein
MNQEICQADEKHSKNIDEYKARITGIKIFEKSKILIFSMFKTYFSMFLHFKINLSGFIKKIYFEAKKCLRLYNLKF